MLRTLSIITKTSLIFARDANGKILIDPVPEKSTFSSKRKKRAVSFNSQVVLQVDNRACGRTAGLTCYSSAENVKRVIQAEYQRGNAATPGFNMLRAEYVPDKNTIGPQGLPMYAVMGSCMIIITVLVAYAVITRRKRVRAKLWTGMGTIPEAPPTKKHHADKNLYPMHPYSSGFPSTHMSPSQSSHFPSPGGTGCGWRKGEDDALLPPYEEAIPGIKQHGPDNISTLHILAKSGTEIDKNGYTDPSGTTFDDEDMITRLVNQGARPDIATDTYQVTIFENTCLRNCRKKHFFS